jgi:hypothetical protein
MRLRLFGLLLSGVVVASSACSVDATRPSPIAAPVSVGRSLSDAGLSTTDLNQDEANNESVTGSSTNASVTYRVTIDPNKNNRLRFGKHTVSLPRHSVCSDNAGYGPAYWNLPCEPETRPITVTVVVTRGVTGYPRVDVLPDRRFNPHKAVVLTLSVPTDIAERARQWQILYCPTGSNACIDESQTDPTLTTFADPERGVVFRRIKHVSGYMVAERGIFGRLLR